MYTRAHTDNSNGSVFIKIALLAVVAFQIITCFLIPAEFERPGEWVPLFSGFWDMEIIMTAGLNSIICGIISIALLLLSVYMLNDRLFSNISTSFTALTFAATLIFCNPRAIYFSSIYPAAICMVWALYCMSISQSFSAFFLLSLAAQFYAPTIWCIPAIMIVMLIESPEPLKSFLKSIGGTLVPIIYVLSFRYLEFNDVGVFCSQYMEQVITIKFAFFSKHLTDLFMILCLIIASLHAVIKTLSEQGHNNIAEAKGLRLVMISAIFAAILYFLFAGSFNGPISIIVAPLLAVLLSYFYTNGHQLPSVRIEMILVICAFVVARLGFFVS